MGSEVEDCYKCNGTGKCSWCGGRGHLDNFFGILREQCPECLGDGKCRVCNGTGKINVNKI